MNSRFFPKTYISAWNGFAFAEAPSLAVFKHNQIYGTIFIRKNFDNDLYTVGTWKFSATISLLVTVFVSWLTNDILQKTVFSLENILYFPAIHIKHVGEITNYNSFFFHF